MNPPFGAQARHADRPFVDAALAHGRTVYSLFNAGTLPFLERYIADRGKIVETISARLVLPRSMAHHRKETVEIPVNASAYGACSCEAHPGEVLRLALGHLAIDVYTTVIPAVIPVLVTEGGLSFLLAGLVLTAYNLTSSIVQPVFGWLADAKGRSVPLALAMLVGGIAIGLFGLASLVPRPDPPCGRRGGHARGLSSDRPQDREPGRSRG